MATMHRVVFEEPYKFIPPHHGKIWPRLIMAFFRYALRKAYGVHLLDIRGADKIRASLAAKHGVLLAANHCRPCDPLVFGQIFKAARTLAYSMVSWHVFKQSPWTEFRVKRLGCFSIYREGADRASMVMAITALKEARRPLALFPEGVITRSNDHLEPFMKGAGFIARQAAVMRSKEDGGKVVLHPIGIRYVFDEPEERAVAAIMNACDDLDRLLELPPDTGLNHRDRVSRILHRVLDVMEAKHLHAPETPAAYDHTGPCRIDDAWHDRQEALIDAMLGPHEEEHQGEKQSADTVSRVKLLRAAILPAMVAKRVDAAERKRRWAQLTDAYYAQELSHIHRDYLSDDAPIERWIEMVERVEELLTMGRWRVIVQIGDAIEVPSKRVRGAEEKDAVILELKDRIQGLLEELRS
ncbi:MAG: lysophospholipid acyltransferase family protein [Planctomycetota bacterium]|jgi:1-acyl-sn-glycerol-3-phosphate acyltransferase